MRAATYDDAARIAYLILVWDRELPEHLRMVRGNAEAAYQAAELMCGPDFATWVVEADGRIVGLISIKNNTSLFGFHAYGNVVGVFVLPKYRNQHLLGLRLLNKGKELKAQRGWMWLEMNPWAGDVRMKRLLGRLGFDETVHTYILR